ncbi:MAG: tRNA preQ1(34) S-adenosylmethionine ribosyltransferase-isomerase QueA [Myxococcaceae bacterium]|nr:tRNA preQ1(34) S-adenosylmethionine ribosyltransferase-isomerase QueA [Myxococcaceae bacterium]MCA3015649.1 tRNA preQ1(34) S-adenosylmethionine ribosyltransferase-isomerase QueA [Myxococcaceae bacterium]
MHTDDFDYFLPTELIAQAPLERRDASRLLHVQRSTGAWAHRRFVDLPSLLRPGDLLVLNDSRVIPARLMGRKVETGGQVELLLVRPTGDISTVAALTADASGTAWVCLGQASKPIRPGAKLAFDDALTAEVLESRGGGEYVVRFTSSLATLEAAIARAGQIPLPPYIDRAPDASDAERYQTVYAATPGSVAAPTAGLHFTPEVFAALEARGVERAFVTLDVGPGTFLPVREGDVASHKMHVERYSVPEVTARRVGEVKARGGRVIAVGTTVVRTLESFAEAGGVKAGTGETALFITPGFEFRVIDGLITNFHLPKSTLVMLVSAFLGREQTLAAYVEAVRERYRFFSYGDSMFIDGGAR